MDFLRGETQEFADRLVIGRQEAVSGTPALIAVVRQDVALPRRVISEDNRGEGKSK
jgi:hypothetical protein